MRRHGPVMVQCTDCVVFLRDTDRNDINNGHQYQKNQKEARTGNFGKITLSDKQIDCVYSVTSE